MRIVLCKTRATKLAEMKAYLAATSQWHRWYAWRPIKVDNIIVWLEHIDRRFHYPFEEEGRTSILDRVEYRVPQ